MPWLRDRGEAWRLRSPRPTLDLEARRQAPGELLRDYPRQLPEQCPALALARRARVSGDSGPSSKP
jgi:hypothetical protein